MHKLVGQIQVQVNEKIYLKNPDSSELGKKIVATSINMIDQFGLEHFTFGKLAKQLETTESSVYRYFESKHKLLIYLTSWYWGWIEYQIIFATSNLQSSEEKLKISIELLSADFEEDLLSGNIPLNILNRIVISESSKAYLNKEVDEANKEGFYLAYKQLVNRLSDITLEINPKFKHGHTLMSTIIEGIHHQKYFAEHLKSLTDITKNNNELGTFYTEMALAILKK